MNTLVPSILNQLLKKWPPGTAALSRWLSEQRVSKDLARVYVKGGWLTSIGTGAYIRAGDSVDWKGGVYALQKHALLPIWPGGLSALMLQGFAHYVPLGGEPLRLFGDSGARLPKWFRNHNWGQVVQFLTPNLFQPVQPDISASKFGAFTIQISSPEKAIFEFLYQVPNTHSFDFAAEISAGLQNLRPGLMKTLLESCRSIKVKRLLLFLATHHKHQWLERINLDNVDLGAGKRQIVTGGRLDPTYLITVPAEFHGEPR